MLRREAKGETSITWKTRGQHVSHDTLTVLRQGSTITAKLLQHSNGDVGVVIVELHTETLE